LIGDAPVYRGKYAGAERRAYVCVGKGALFAAPIKERMLEEFLQGSETAH
jgi:hypothetical protein